MRSDIAGNLKPVTLLAFLIFSGCATPYSFKVDAINNPETGGHESFTLVSSNAEIGEEDLQFKEVARYVKTALSGNGLYEAPDAEHADMIVDIAYGISDSKIDFKTVSVPAYQAHVVDPRDPSGAQGNGRRRLTVVIEQKVIPITVHEKYLRLTARDNSSREFNEAPAQIWTIYIKHKDEDDDLRKFIPLMAAAAVDYIGENTENQKEIKLKETDDVVAFVREGM